ncbi:ABC transporter ATP-binding protein [Cryobacterium sp. TMT1-21]|uniref:ABC transporter ATP-binding protein n=1 Tax=Cryobacterium shii TaxID=1259235 RepID=A0AAQ2C530_9MICO|nr:MULTISPECIES: ATP-binding cassette domain-containing protein [Cryobacterium]TFC44379.1 ABC transporter ATP-binding protein [Cryobacterium shii]TFC88449.1 ABC transporter ATP-binding protein [Cryobacterium sp. TmT2-59]TFD17929.1 ABC transporter ATP-binding protein [Cryobacterium sp. TMT1-21]TFD18924.1 ABC transporter ATP-binding protein [Cryobacterium sp. TMT2-23]TFD20956.1 ABC transporter ATP-binding protein [Cryobacterium sp. TMT4-10]
MTTPAITVESLTKTFHTGHSSGAVTALDAVTLTVESGSCLAVVGESGSGKTTLARIIVGLETSDSGTVRVAGHPVAAKANRRELRRRARQIQMVFQDPQSSLNRRLPVQTAVDEVLRAHTSLDRAARRARCIELFAQVGLEPHQLGALPGELSGGQRQRVAIARALAADPAVIVLDESVAALDVTVQAQILALLTELRQSRGLTYLFITHDLSVVQMIADQVVVMRRGSIVERGSTAEVLTNPQHPYTQLLLECAPRPGWKPQRGVIRALREEITS